MNGRLYTSHDLFGSGQTLSFHGLLQSCLKCTSLPSTLQLSQPLWIFDTDQKSFTWTAPIDSIAFSTFDFSILQVPLLLATSLLIPCCPNSKNLKPFTKATRLYFENARQGMKHTTTKMTVCRSLFSNLGATVVENCRHWKKAMARDSKAQILPDWPLHFGIGIGPRLDVQDNKKVKSFPNLTSQTTSSTAMTLQSIKTSHNARARLESPFALLRRRTSA